MVHPETSLRVITPTDAPLRSVEVNVGLAPPGALVMVTLAEPVQFGDSKVTVSLYLPDDAWIKIISPHCKERFCCKAVNEQ